MQHASDLVSDRELHDGNLFIEPLKKSPGGGAGIVISYVAAQRGRQVALPHAHRLTRRCFILVCVCVCGVRVWRGGGGGGYVAGGARRSCGWRQASPAVCLLVSSWLGVDVVDAVGARGAPDHCQNAISA